MRGALGNQRPYRDTSPVSAALIGTFEDFLWRARRASEFQTLVSIPLSEPPTVTFVTPSSTNEYCLEVYGSAPLGPGKSAKLPCSYYNLLVREAVTGT